MIKCCTGVCQMIVVLVSARVFVRHFVAHVDARGSCRSPRHGSNQCDVHACRGTIDLCRSSGRSISGCMCKCPTGFGKRIGARGPGTGRGMFVLIVIGPAAFRLAPVCIMIHTLAHFAVQPAAASRAGDIDLMLACLLFHVHSGCLSLELRCIFAFLWVSIGTSMAHGAWAGEIHLGPPQLDGAAAMHPVSTPYHSSSVAAAVASQSPWAAAPSQSTLAAASSPSPWATHSAAPALPAQGVQQQSAMQPAQMFPQQAASPAGTAVRAEQPTMFLTLQPLAAAAEVPAAASSVQQTSSPAASSPAPAAVVQPVAAEAVPPPQIPAYRMWGEEWVVTWQVEAEDGKGELVWRDYDEASQEMLENHFRLVSGQPLTATPKGHVKFVYDIANMFQQNTETQKKRMMRRTLQHNAEWLLMPQRTREIAEFNASHWDPTPYYERSGGKAGGSGKGWKGHRSRSTQRR